MKKQNKTRREKSSIIKTFAAFPNARKHHFNPFCVLKIRKLTNFEVYSALMLLLINMRTAQLKTLHAKFVLGCR